MNQTSRTILLLPFVIASFISHSQNSERIYNGDEKYLRACVQWNDSTEYQTPEYTGSNRTVYKFRIRNLSWGIYREQEIYVVTRKSDLNKFNRARKLGRDYYWTLRKTEHSIENQAIYLHSGNF